MKNQEFFSTKSTREINTTILILQGSIWISWGGIIEEPHEIMREDINDESYENLQQSWCNPDNG